MSFCIALNDYWIQEPTANMLIRMYLDYKPPRRREEVDRKLLTQMVGKRPKKLSRAPKHLQLAAEQMRKEAKERKRG